MEKQIILSTNENPAAKAGNIVNALTETARRAAEAANLPLRWLRGYYSTVLERPLSMKQANAITTAQVAFFATVMPVECHLVVRCAACAWLIISLMKCRKLIRD